MKPPNPTKSAPGGIGEAVRLPLVEWLRLLGYAPEVAKGMTVEEVARALVGIVRNSAVEDGDDCGTAPRPYTGISREPQSARLLTVREAALQVGCSEDSIRRAYTCRELKVSRFGAGRVRVTAEDLNAWLARGGHTKTAP